MSGDDGMHQQLADNLSSLPAEVGTEPRWFAIHTRARHERKVALELERAQVETFLPMTKELHRWSDRVKAVEVPLFSCYVFVRIAPGSKQRLTILTASGVLAFVGSGGGSPIPDSEIDAVRSVVESKVPFSRCMLSKGQRVRVRGGVLDGVEGVLLSGPDERRLQISVGAINQSLSISLQGYELEAA
jgi:transcription antitermination factor NusG